MPTAFQWQITAEQHHELEQLRDHDAAPYLRERAAVLLKVTAGLSIVGAARSGGLRPHHQDTVRRWVRRYRAEGVAGLRVRKGRGRKPASFRRRA